MNIRKYIYIAVVVMAFGVVPAEGQTEAEMMTRRYTEAYDSLINEVRTRDSSVIASSPFI